MLTGVGLAGATVASAFPAPQRTLYAYVSSWTKGPGGAGGGGGISVFTVNMNDGSLTPVSRTGPEFDSLNGGNICISSDGRFLYATNERNNLDDKLGAGGGVLSFAINRNDGSLTHLNTQPSMGVDPCFIVSRPEPAHACLWPTMAAATRLYESSKQRRSGDRGPLSMTDRWRCFQSNRTAALNRPAMWPFSRGPTVWTLSHSQTLMRTRSISILAVISQSLAMWEPTISMSIE